MDFVTMFPRTTIGYDTIWVVVDRLTKSSHFIPIKEMNMKEKLTRTYLKEIVRLHGVPCPLSLTKILGLRLVSSGACKNPLVRA